MWDSNAELSEISDYEINLNPNDSDIDDTPAAVHNVDTKQEIYWFYSENKY